MRRKQFIESQGATCRNWTWSWSFINKEEKIIIFGAWDLHTEGNTSLILGEDWQTSRKGRKQPAYKQSREHIRLIEEEGYKLKTFPMKYSNANEDEQGIGPAKIEGFEPELKEKSLKRVGRNWYASDDALGNVLPEEVETPEQYIEGASKAVTVNTYERNSDARAKCIKHYGYKCAVCDFDFEAAYGTIGKNYIHVHHIVPLSEIRKEYELDPIEDLIPVCPNCHAVIHRTRPALTVAQLKQHLAENKNSRAE
jgi:5-methylcytosine-specific restriction protein A